MESVATVSLQVSVESLISAVSGLSLKDKQRLVEALEQQIFEAEEAAYKDDAETIAEIEAVQAEYAAGECQSYDDYLKERTA